MCIVCMTAFGFFFILLIAYGRLPSKYTKKTREKAKYKLLDYFLPDFVQDTVLTLTQTAYYSFRENV